MADFSVIQGHYLAYIHAFTSFRGYPPTEAEIAMAMCVTPTSAHQMVKMLEKKGLLLRQPGKPRSLRILIPANEIPSWKNGKAEAPSSSLASGSQDSPAPVVAKPEAPPAKLYVLTVRLSRGRVTEQFIRANPRVIREIEIRGDQTLEQLHRAIFEAYDRRQDRDYEFQLGSRFFDPDGIYYRLPDSPNKNQADRDVQTTKLDDLSLVGDSILGYVFGSNDSLWLHQIDVKKVDKAISTVTYPRLSKRIGKSPPLIN